MKILATMTLALIILGVSISSLYAQVYDIPDPAFKKLILEELNKPDGELMAEDYQQIAGIEWLFVHNGDIKNIEGIQNFKSLVSLHFSKNPINDLSPVAELKNLEELIFTEMSKIDLSPLANLEKLEDIQIFAMPITDLSSFSELENLKFLTLWETKITDFSPVPSLSNLKELYIDTDRNIDNKSLSKWENLESLKISWDYGMIPEDEDFSKVAPLDVSQLSNLKKLKEIVIRYPKLINYESLSSLGNLKHLNLSYVDELNLAFISEMHGLETIELSNPEISDLKPLSGLENLESIRIERNNLEDISPLFDMKNLKEVSIALNPDSGDVIKDQLKNLENKNIKARRLYLSSVSTLTLRALGSSELAYQDQNPDKNFGTWDEMMENEYIQQGYTRETIIDGYNLVVFEATPSVKNEIGEIVKESTFKIVAVPLDTSSGLEIYAIDESQQPKVWIGDGSQWDIRNIDLNNQDLWVPVDD
jgi:hypothetical protein